MANTMTRGTCPVCDAKVAVGPTPDGLARMSPHKDRRGWPPLPVRRAPICHGSGKVCKEDMDTQEVKQ